jgi:DNA invertase Pin-like site-specific DNA recombinase
VFPKGSPDESSSSAQYTTLERLQVSAPKTIVYNTLLRMKVAIYTRVSTSDGRQTVENQVRQLCEFCNRRGFEIVAEYADEGSGGSGDRPGFKRMYADAHKRLFEGVVFWSLDRFSREGVLPTLQRLEQLTAYGVAWISFSEQYLDSTGPFKEAVVSIMAALAKQERVRLSERTKAGLERARAEGKPLGRPRKVLDRRKVVEARKSGASYGEIAKLFGISRSSALRISRG